MRTFVSYSHDSEDHKRLVLGFADQLRKQGIDCILDQYEESPEEGWPRWMEAELGRSSNVLVVCSKGYFDKLQPNAKPGGKGVKWEGAIITQEIYDQEGRNKRFIPVLFGEENRDYIPCMLRPFTHYDLFQKVGYEKLYRRLTRQPSVTKPPLGNVIKLPNARTAPDNAPIPRGDGLGNVQQNMTGSNNVQAGIVYGNLNVKSQGRPVIQRLPPPGTIRANTLLKQAIIERFNKLGEEREKRFGKDAYGVMYRIFKTDFAIRKIKWTAIWDWPEAMGDAIIKYLDEKYANTISGRIAGAIERGTAIPGRGHLYAREKELLEQIGLSISSPPVKESLSRYFGVNSHTKLTIMKHWQWVEYLEQLVKKMIGE
jgi:hypothetical protein